MKTWSKHDLVPWYPKANNAMQGVYTLKIDCNFDNVVLFNRKYHDMNILIEKKDAEAMVEEAKKAGFLLEHETIEEHGHIQYWFEKTKKGKK